MKPLTEEWIAKAEGDFATAGREFRARKSPNYDAVCFHTQQCVEKYLKAVLQENEMEFGRTHNLSGLLDKITPAYPFLETIRPSLHLLNAFAIDFRYPGESADKALAGKAYVLCSDVRHSIRTLLNLEPMN
ncbi:MAG TPA: DNA-binding protein [Geobacter sp.]|nr:DNA-binding protein [Geobacter sp.]